jgi:hypothetical protein
MILGMTPLVFAHTVLSLVGIFAGIVALFGLLSANRLPGWTALFLAATILTSASGFVLPADHIKPSHVVGVVSLVVLAIALYALYSQKLRGAWRWIYAGAAVVALWLNVFVLIAQAFLKIEPLRALAPTGTEPPFMITEGVGLVAFVILGLAALVRFHPAVDY